MDKITDPANGLDFLDKLREKNQNKGKTFDELSWFLEQRAREQGVPIYGQFELTPICNLDCKMCYTHLTKEQMKGRSLLTTEQWKDLMRQAYELGMYQAALTGGECLTYPGFQELYLYLQSLGCEVSVLTNGLLLDERWIEFFKEHTPSKIQITLYGYDEDSYERVTGQRVFSAVKRNIERIKAADLPLQIAITPNLYMAKSAVETVRTAKNLCQNVRINSSLFDAREETGRSGEENDLDEEQYIEFYRSLSEMEGRRCESIPEEQLPPVGAVTPDSPAIGLRCGGGRSGFAITWNGIMNPCGALYQIKAEPLREGMRAAWEKLNYEAEHWPRVRECDSCPYEPTCENCAAVMMRFVQPGKRPKALCERTRKMIAHGIWKIPDCE